MRNQKCKGVEEVSRSKCAQVHYGSPGAKVARITKGISVPRTTKGVLVLKSWCRRLGCACRLRGRTRRIGLWYGKLGRTRAEKDLMSTASRHNDEKRISWFQRSGDDKEAIFLERLMAFFKSHVKDLLSIMDDSFNCAGHTIEYFIVRLIFGTRI